MTPTERLTAATHNTVTTPFLFWNELNVCAGGAALACPQCAGPSLHLDTIDFATPTDGHYTPAVGVSIDPITGAVLADNQACGLHASQNRGPMLSIGYWCEEGCRGRIELRQHKGHIYASLHHTTSDLAQTAFGGPTAPTVAALTTDSSVAARPDSL